MALAMIGSSDVVGETVYPGLTIHHGEPVVTTPLVTVSVNPGALEPVEMAFSHDGTPFLPWEPFQPVREWVVENPEQAYQAHLTNLNNGQAFSEWDNEYGTLAWGESFVLDSLLSMYEATNREVYLEQFVTHADAVIAQGDDHVGRPDYRGLALPGWSTSGPVTLARTVFSDTLGGSALEISGRSRLRQSQVSVRLTLTSTTTDTLWTLDVHRSMAGRCGMVLSDTAPITSVPNWEIEVWPDVLYPGDALVYDTYYPWFVISEIRLYGIEGNGVQTDDFELYAAMHADTGEYTRISSFSLKSLVDQQQPVLAFQDLAQWGRYWKVRYVGDQSQPFHPEPGRLMAVYEVGLPPISERFSAPDLETLAANVELGSTLVRAQVVGGQPFQTSSAWRFLTPQRYRMALHTGLITYPLLRFVLLVEQENLGPWLPKAQQYLQYARAAVDSHDDEWCSVSAVRGYYIFREDAPVWPNGVNLPYNHQAAIGRSLVLLYDLTREETYRMRAMQIAQILRDGLIYDAETDSYWWYYWFGEGYDGWQDVPGRFVPTYEGYKGVESIFYASIDSDFARQVYAHKMIFSVDDIIRLSNTFLNRLTTEDGQLYCYVDGSGGTASVSKASGVDLFAVDFSRAGARVLDSRCVYGDAMTTTEYLGFTEVIPAVYRRVEVVQPFPPMLSNEGRAPYGLAQLVYYATWRLSPQPGDHTLGVQVRDAQGVIGGPWFADVVLKPWCYYLPLVIRNGVVH
jgi:hypothetical protein